MGTMGTMGTVGTMGTMVPCTMSAKGTIGTMGTCFLGCDSGAQSVVVGGCTSAIAVDEPRRCAMALLTAGHQKQHGYYASMGTRGAVVTRRWRHAYETRCDADEGNLNGAIGVFHISMHPARASSRDLILAQQAHRTQYGFNLAPRTRCTVCRRKRWQMASLKLTSPNLARPCAARC